ncbi:hypothetical protein ACOSP7_016516 [Xanthoceras sorbifolium]
MAANPAASKNSTVIVESDLTEVVNSLQRWNAITLQKFQRDIRRKRDDMDRMANDSTINSWSSVGKAEVQLNLFLDTEEKYCSQHSRIGWLKKGDHNTKFFHNRASNRKRRNTILGLFDKHDV